MNTFPASGRVFLWVGRRRILDVLILSSALSVSWCRADFLLLVNQLERYKQRPLAIPRLALSFSPAFRPLPFHFIPVLSFSSTTHLSLHSRSLPSFFPSAPSLLLSPSSPLCFSLALSSPCVIP